AAGRPRAGHRHGLGPSLEYVDLSDHPRGAEPGFPAGPGAGRAAAARARRPRPGRPRPAPSLGRGGRLGLAGPEMLGALQVPEVVGQGEDLLVLQVGDGQHAGARNPLLDDADPVLEGLVLAVLGPAQVRRPGGELADEQRVHARGIAVDAVAAGARALPVEDLAAPVALDL